jgi:hypothetical protein
MRKYHAGRGRRVMMRAINAYATLARVTIAVLADDPPVDSAVEAPVAAVPPVGSGTVIVVVGPLAVVDAEPEPKSTLVAPPLLGVDVVRIGAVMLRLIEDTLVPLQRVL